AGVCVAGEDGGAAFCAGDRPRVRRTRPHHGAARRAQDRGAGGPGYRAVRRGRVAEAAIAGIGTGQAPPQPLPPLTPEIGEWGRENFFLPPFSAAKVGNEVLPPLHRRLIRATLRSPRGFDQILS